jgi:hypothetical protein
MSKSLALLLGLPAHEASFYARIGSSDFLSRYSPATKHTWEQYFDQVGRRFLDLGNFASRLGFAVFWNAGLRELASATQDFKAVVVLSHWKGPGISHDDLVDQDIDKYISFLGGDNGGDVAALKARLEALRNPDLKGLTKALSTFLDNESSLNEMLEGEYEVVASPFAQRSANRDALDNMFAGLLRPGNRIELSDGLHDKETVAAAIAPKFDGVLDLTTCTSTYLSDYLGRIARGRFLSIQFDNPQVAAYASLLLRHTFKLYRSGTSYLNARRQALLDLEEVLKRIKESEGASGHLNDRIALLIQERDGKAENAGWLSRIVGKFRSDF